MDFKTELLKLVLPAAITALGAAGTYALSKLASWLDSKTASNKLAAALDALPHMAQAVLAKIEADTSAALQADLAKGPLTSDELKALKDLALQDLKDALKNNGLAALEGAFGPLLDGVLSKVLSKVAPAAVPK